MVMMKKGEMYEEITRRKCCCCREYEKCDEDDVDDEQLESLIRRSHLVSMKC